MGFHVLDRSEIVLHTCQDTISKKEVGETCVREDVEKLELLYTIGGNEKMMWVPWQIVWSFLKTLKIALPYNPAVPPLGIYPEVLKSGS